MNSRFAAKKNIAFFEAREYIGVASVCSLVCAVLTAERARANRRRKGTMDQ